MIWEYKDKVLKDQMVFTIAIILFSIAISKFGIISRELMGAFLLGGGTIHFAMELLRAKHEKPSNKTKKKKASSKGKVK